MQKTRDHYFQECSPVIDLPPNTTVLDLSTASDMAQELKYSIGKYNEDRRSMYQTESYLKKARTIHIGIDLGAPAEHAFTHSLQEKSFMRKITLSRRTMDPPL